MFRWRYGLLGMAVLPYTFISLALPIIFLPLLYIAIVTSALNGGLATVGIFAAVFTAGQGFICFCGLLITRSSLRNLLVVPLFRVISEPLRIYLLYRSLFAALKGREHGWNKLARTGTVELAPALPAPPPGELEEAAGLGMSSVH
jgi:biofilm PGA synthesis N-glycosyltransferase PgaC